MNPFKLLWGTFFRLFPCPSRVGLFSMGNPGPKSPVLVTCNFYITVRRVMKNLAGTNAWLLVADSKGVNVWCAAGGDEFNTRSVVSAIKTSGIEERVEHRKVILPPPGCARHQGKRGPGTDRVDCALGAGSRRRYPPLP
ncbi:hypothetical protein ACFL4N_09510 [Thermodesulfobacteriota bacterium]